MNIMLTSGFICPHTNSAHRFSEEKLCLVYEPDGTLAGVYVGRMLAGYGSLNLRFPVSFTRELTDEEIQVFVGSVITCGYQAPLKLVRGENGLAYKAM